MACTLDLVARLVEEQTREESMDRIDPVNHSCDGHRPGVHNSLSVIRSFQPRQTKLKR